MILSFIQLKVDEALFMMGTVIAPYRTSSGPKDSSNILMASKYNGSALSNAFLTL